ncbi:hypothetical protein O6H91_09G023700 [Diphasiastrum complanatum]|uniref:Uncharacterized protein n=1 Tax=Diphasiastrum complanatum TaxID=34168 RepID=A0ACC2CM66_DIPCM|nr:hypothetical protein O6H91_09G023700 [Diphasiastrum complanatum]
MALVFLPRPLRWASYGSNAALRNACLPRMSAARCELAADTFSGPMAFPFCPQVANAAHELVSEFYAVDCLVACNIRRVLKAFANARVGTHHFGSTTGYGHNDAGGREALDKAFAEIAGAEAAIFRPQFFSGTHAIACALFSVLRPSGELLSVVGAPYETLEEVIGLRGAAGQGSLKEFGVSYREVPFFSGTHAIACALFSVLRPSGELLSVVGAPYETLEEVIGLRGAAGQGSLKEFGVSYREVPLSLEGGIDWKALSVAVRPETQCALIQRSCGYSWRQSLTIADIERAVRVIQAQNPCCTIVVDNCYGEFVETTEPTAVGVDIIAGSLIKNPGGTVAPCGGYIAGKTELVAAAAARLSAPGIGLESGSVSADVMRLLFQGLFLSPQMVGESIKGGMLLSKVMHDEGYKVRLKPGSNRHDVIQAVELGSQQRLLAFCKAVQEFCPVGSYIQPIAGATAGYGSEVIFADGTFIDGSTSELSCDGPLKEPYVVFCQGGTHWTHWGLVLGGVLEVLDQL